MAKSITLTKSQMDNIKDIDVNGAAIKDIIIEYSQHFISIPVIKPFPKPVVGILLFQGVVYSEISSHEPFGEGCYILNFDVKVDIPGDNIYFNINNVEDLNALIKNNSCFKATIELNSGDRISIIANQLLYSMEESEEII